MSSSLIPAALSGGSAARLGSRTAILTAVLTAVFAALGVTTPARSGPFCGSDCVAYPYVDVAQFIPRDYFWLVPGILLAPTVIVLMACIHATATEPHKIYSRIGLSLAVVYAGVILVDYVLQLAIVVPSLQAGESAGLSLVTQYNPHGVFIALEALGYTLMTLAFLFVAAVFQGGRAERAIRLLYVGSFVLTLAAFIGVALLGHTLVGFEVAVLTITYVELITSSALLIRVFRNAGRAAAQRTATRPQPVQTHR